LVPHFITVRSKLSALFRSKYSEHLRHHSRVRDFHLDLDLCARLGCRSHRSFIELAVQWIALAFGQCAHLLVQCLIALLEALLDRLDPRALIVRQVELPTERTKRPKPLSRTTGPARTTASRSSRTIKTRRRRPTLEFSRRPTGKTTLSWRRTWPRPARLLRRDDGGSD
jgi:hypothetical protein